MAEGGESGRHGDRCEGVCFVVAFWRVCDNMGRVKGGQGLLAAGCGQAIRNLVVTNGEMTLTGA